MALVAHQAYHPDSSPPTLSDLLKVPKNEEHTFAQDKFSLRSQYDEEPSYVFDNPAIALHLLNNLDVFEVVKAGEVPGAKYTAYTEGYTYDYDYCKKHRAYFVENPEIVFGELNFITNYWMDHKLRTTVIPEIGYDLMPEVSHSYKNRTRVYKFDFRLDGTMFFMFNIFSKWRQVGVQFSCLSQESNHIPGHDSMARKDKLGAALVAYAQKYESKPHCFNFDKYFPKTWVMQDKKQCLDFFQEFLSPRYEELKKERKVVYFRKIGANVHEGKGVFPLNSEKEENFLRKTYKDGALCGKVKKNFLMQTNVHNLLLLDGRKFGVRVFLLVASVNPVIAYFHDGYYRLSMHKYDPNSTTRGTFVTNIGVNLINPADGKTEEQIQEETTWYNKQVQDFLLETNVIQDPHWVDNYLRPEYKKVMVHLLRMAQSKFVPVSSVFEIHGIDFIMDQNLNLWFIEANPYPLINGFTKESTVLLNKMLIDMFEIQAGLLKSRMKRVIQYINLLSSTMKSDSDVISNLAQKRQQFRELSKNYFEPEYVPKPGNGFQKIVDENLQGADRYAGLIEPQCL